MEPTREAMAAAKALLMVITNRGGIPLDEIAVTYDLYAAARVAEAVAPYKAMVKAALEVSEDPTIRCETAAIYNLRAVLAALPAAENEYQPKTS